jgi:diguanylate cyclase (GGDEF)-like protein
MSLFEDSGRRLWVGTFGGGLSQLDRATGAFTHYESDPTNPLKLASDRVTSVAEDPSGLLWVGTDGGGLHVLNPKTGTFFRLRHDPENSRSLSADTVYCIHIDAAGQVWIGTRGGGLDRVVGSATTPDTIRFSHLSEKDGLPNSTVYGIHSDADGQLWLSTNFGIARLNPKTRKIRAFHRADGLQEEEFNFGAHYASAAGKLFFGGAGGFNEIVPATLDLATTAPPVVITSVLLPNGPALTGAAAARLRDLHLPYRENDVTFEFAALDFTAPLSNRFQYRLEGAGDEWVDSGTRRSISYSNLSGGTYLLRVRAASADGVWNKADTAVRLRVDPPPWKSAWAYAAYAFLSVITMLTAWILIRRRLIRDEQQRNKLEQLVLERTRDLAAHASALEVANQKLEEASLTDPLTGLGNRRSLHESLPRLIAQLPRSKRLAVMIADLDCLKPINDELGHEAGDHVLVGVSAILRQHLRETDTLVRWGGDEFVLVHTCTDLDAAAAFAERMRSAVSQYRFTLPSSQVARTSCSIGFALYPFVDQAPDLLDWTGVLRLADSALYRAKRKRNAWVGWSGCAARTDIEARLLKDADRAAAERIIDARESQAATEETIEILLRAKRSRAVSA